MFDWSKSNIALFAQLVGQGLTQASAMIVNAVVTQAESEEQAVVVDATKIAYQHAYERVDKAISAIDDLVSRDKPKDIYYDALSEFILDFQVYIADQLEQHESGAKFNIRDIDTLLQDSLILLYLSYNDESEAWQFCLSRDEAEMQNKHDEGCKYIHGMFKYCKKLKKDNAQEDHHLMIREASRLIKTAEVKINNLEEHIGLNVSDVKESIIILRELIAPDEYTNVSVTDISDAMTNLKKRIGIKYSEKIFDAISSSDKLANSERSRSTLLDWIPDSLSMNDDPALHSDFNHVAQSLGCIGFQEGLEANVIFLLEATKASLEKKSREEKTILGALEEYKRGVSFFGVKFTFMRNRIPDAVALKKYLDNESNFTSKLDKIKAWLDFYDTKNISPERKTKTNCFSYERAFYTTLKKLEAFYEEGSALEDRKEELSSLLEERDSSLKGDLSM
jgi:hypothetical protein